jgi:hypothetical protein
VPRRPTKRAAMRRRTGGNPLTRPLTLKWIGGSVGGIIATLVAVEGASRAWNYFGGPHFATQEWTTSLVGGIKLRLETVAATTNVLGLQNRLVTLQANRDAVSRERSQIEFTMRTVRDASALDFMKHRLDTVDASAKSVDREIDRVNAQIAVAENPTGRKRAHTSTGDDYDEKPE